MNAEYQALTTAAGLVDFRDRTLMEASGADAAKFIQSFCTNDVLRLPMGGGCEAFIPSVQGKVIAHVVVCREGDRVVLETVPAAAERLIAHLDRYVLSSQVTLTDRSQDWAEILLGGSASRALLRQRLGIEPPAVLWSLVSAPWAGENVIVQRADAMLAGPAFLLRGTRQRLGLLKHDLISAGAVACTADTFDAVRIEAGWPLFGRDITEQNFPQEVDRNTQTISFTKGCYLGQETVARIDALGHVNRKLRGLKFAGQTVPEVGLPLSDGDRVVGEVTSARFSPRLGCPLALGYVRRGHYAPGKRLQSSLGEVEVIPVPL